MMKRCPECYEVYDDHGKFCEIDGQALLADPTFFVEETESGPPEPDWIPDRPQPRDDSLLIGLVGVIVGIFLCAGAYVTHLLWSAGEIRDRDAPVYASGMREPAPSVRPAPPSTTESIEPGDDAAIDPDAEDAVELPPETKPANDHQAVAPRLNQGPVSTGERDREGEDAEVHTVIQMNDGSTMDVDAAWEDKQGVWYRRGGLVSFVDSQRVKAITARAAPKSSP